MNTPAGFRLVERPGRRHRSVRGDVQSGRWRAGRAHAAGGVRGGRRRRRRHPCAPAAARRTNAFHRAAFAIALVVGLPAALLQPLSGDWAGRVVARTQPAKLAALEGHFDTEPYAPLRIGGMPDVEARETRYAIEIPGGLSLLAHGDPAAPRHRPERHPARAWPPVRCGAHRVSGDGRDRHRGSRCSRCGRPCCGGAGGCSSRALFLKAVLWSTPLGFIAIEAGWMVTELGRQPWIIQGVMRTSDAVTPMPGLVVPFVVVHAALHRPGGRRDRADPAARSLETRPRGRAR